jgi:hypothetical protein
MSELRNPAVVAEIDGAIARRSYGDLFVLLRRLSGLPGPRANEKLAWAIAHEIAERGARADALVTELCRAGRGRVFETGSIEFLSMIGSFCLASRGGPIETALAELRELAEDPRHLVRESVVAALGDMSRSHGDELAVLLGAWTDGYLSASVALDAITSRSWLDRQKTHEPALARIEEAFTTTEAAGRADQRSQGYRTLVKTLPEAISRLTDRFPDATIAWLESRSATEHVELREALGDVVHRIRARGHGAGKLERFERLLAASAPPRRDPRTYVGPTRKRGSRRR